jgi:diguanylate cyclase (GGDEF)-like protein
MAQTAAQAGPMIGGGVIDRARLLQRRQPWRSTVSQQVLTRHARGYCHLVTAGAAFALLATAVPRPAPAVAFSVGTLAGGAALVACILWREAARITRPALWLLAILGTALASAAAATAASRPSVPGAGVALSHGDWVFGCGALMLGALVVRRLLDELRHRIGLLDSLARTDSLTLIPNRRAWDEELPREVARARRDGSGLCVAILDLDHFKAFNDMRGHQEGDLLLSRVASAWRDEVRASDFIARYGGEEFAVILRGCSLQDALPIVERVRLVMTDGQTCSVGVARWDGVEQADTLVRRADEALFEAKAAGRDRVKIAANPGADWGQARAVPWPAIVRELLEERSVIAAYQPVVELEGGTIVAYEALARPNHDRVDISVERMFSSAQRMGLGRDLDWLCRRAALAGAGWMPRGMPLFINCGISALLDPVHRVDQMLLVLEAVDRPPSEVVLEITERELVGDLNRLRQVVTTYRQQGFRFAIDDVGEGHSTLEVLAATEPEFVKVARSLVVEAWNRGPQAAIRALVAFAASMDAQVIAEGIEEAGVATAMRHLGVGLGQGYLFGRPAYPEAAAPAAPATPQPVAAGSNGNGGWSVRRR